MRKIIEIAIKEVLCAKDPNNEYIIYKHDSQNTTRVIKEIMEIIDMVRERK